MFEWRKVSQMWLSFHNTASTLLPQRVAAPIRHYVSRPFSSCKRWECFDCHIDDLEVFVLDQFLIKGLFHQIELAKWIVLGLTSTESLLRQNALVSERTMSHPRIAVRFH